MSSLRFISFFAGIGGIDLGLERAGHKCVGQVEINPFCQRVLAKHWPNTWRHDDITTLKPEDIPAADLWTGGFPCQDISNAGKRAGIYGERSGLFFDFMRLVREVRPRYLLLENVAALLVRGMGEVLGELAESGYDAEWRICSAAEMGAPHQRSRLFVIAYADKTRRFAQSIFTRRIPEIYRPCLWESYGTVNQHIWLTSDCGLSRNDGRVPGSVDRIAACGNAVVPQVAEYIGRLLMDMPEKG